MKNIEVSEPVSSAGSARPVFFSSIPAPMSPAVAASRADDAPKHFSLSDRIKKFLGITKWSDMLKGDQEHFGF